MSIDRGRMPHGIRVLGRRVPGSEEILTPEALDFVAGLHRAFNPVREALLERRAERQAEIDSGAGLYTTRRHPTATNESQKSAIARAKKKNKGE